jgi:glyceraldehyde 3-phosphate dehydrogenase
VTHRVAINGLGRIGRAILKLVVEEPSFDLVAINDLVDVENLGYLLRFDTVYGRYSKTVVVDQDKLLVAGREVRALRERDPSRLPWKDLDVDLVFECTGRYRGGRISRSTSTLAHALSSYRLRPKAAR